MYSYFMTIDHPTQRNVKGMSKESQRNVKGKSKERVMNVCLYFTCRIKARCLLLIIPRTLYGILKKTNKGLSWIKWQSNSSFVRKKYPFSEADSNLIRTRLEQMSQKRQKYWKKWVFIRFGIVLRRIFWKMGWIF